MQVAFDFYSEENDRNDIHIEEALRSEGAETEIITDSESKHAVFNREDDFGSFSFEDIHKCLKGIKNVRIEILKFFREKEPGVLIEAFSSEILENDSVMNIFVGLDNKETGEHLFLRGNKSLHTDKGVAYYRDDVQDIIFDALTDKNSCWHGPLLMEHEAKLYLMSEMLDDYDKKHILRLFRKRNRYSDEIYQRMLPKLTSLTSSLINIEKDFNGNVSPSFEEVFSVASTSFFSLLNVYDLEYGIRFFFGMVEQGVRRAIKEFLIEHRYCVKVPPGKIISNSIKPNSLPSSKDVEIIDVFNDRIEVNSGVILTSDSGLDNNTHVGELGMFEIESVENEIIMSDFNQKLLKIEAIFALCSRRFGGKKKALEKHNRLLQEIERYCYGQ